MSTLLQSSTYFGLLLSLAAFAVGLWVQRRFGSGPVGMLLNPLLVAIILVICLLLVARIDYSTYSRSADYLTYLLTPATVCLAVPLHCQFDKLKAHAVPIFAGVLVGVLVNLVGIWAMGKAFGVDRVTYVTLLPKSITTAIGIGLSEEFGGIVAITVASIVITGNLGALVAEPLCRAAGITDPVARGVGIGTSAHVIGTVRAMQLGEIEGAMGSLAIIVAGLLTVGLAPLFVLLW